MRNLILIIALFLLAPFSCTEEVSKHINEELQSCMKKNNYTTSGMTNCVYDSISKLEKEIKKYNKLILKKLPKNKKTVFFENHKQWENYRISQAKLVHEIMDEKLGTIYQNISAGYDIELYEERLLFLKNIYSEIAE